jgi:hypothetical protein
MLKLQNTSRELYWIDLVPGVRLELRPVTVAAMLLARAAAGDAISGKPEGRGTNIAASEAFTRALAQSGIANWEGVGDANGEPVKATPETIDQLMDVIPAFDAFDRLYVAPALLRDQEKNA